MQIAKKTLRMPDAAVGIMPGPDKDESREILKAAGWPDKRIADWEGYKGNPPGGGGKLRKFMIIYRIIYANGHVGPRSPRTASFGRDGLEAEGNLIDMVHTDEHLKPRDQVDIIRADEEPAKEMLKEQQDGRALMRVDRRGLIR